MCETDHRASAAPCLLLVIALVPLGLVLGAARRWDRLIAKTLQEKGPGLCQIESVYKPEPKDLRVAVKPGRSRSLRIAPVPSPPPALQARKTPMSVDPKSPVTSVAALAEPGTLPPNETPPGSAATSIDGQ
jgi:hypothetical protein